MKILGSVGLLCVVSGISGGASDQCSPALAGATAGLMADATGRVAAVTARRMAKQPPAGDLCSPPDEAASFLTTDERAVLWFTTSGHAVGDVVARHWFEPSGAQYATGQWNPLGQGGSHCFVAWIGIAGNLPATKPGAWRVDVRVNGVFLFSQSFTIVAPGAVSPAIAAGGIVNSADYTANLAPGGLFSIYGAGLAADTVAADTVPLPTSLRGTSVDVLDADRTLPAPLVFVSPGQINAQMPYGLRSSGVLVRVRTAGGVSGLAPVSVQSSAPRLFTRTLDGRGEAIALHANYQLIDAQRPATPGEVIILYLTGLGEVQPPVAAGTPAGDGGAGGPLSRTVETVSVTVGGAPARVHFSGLAPGFAGLYQLNVELAPSMAGGNLEIQVSTPRASCQSGVRLAVGGGGGGGAVASATIGPSGGTVAGSGVQVVIPAGAWAASQPLRILREPDDADFTRFQTSEWFRVEGVPESRTRELQVRLRKTRLGPGTGSAFVLLREEGVDAPAPQILDATVEGDEIVFTLPPPEADVAPRSAGERAADASQAASEDTAFSVTAIAGVHALYSSERHFKVYYPVWDLVEGAADLIADRLEEAYRKLHSDIGFSWAGRSWYPIAVEIVPFSSATGEYWGESIPSKLGNNFYKIGLNAAYALNRSNFETLAITAAHELFHLLQWQYDPRGRYTRATRISPWLWMNEAASTWLERRVARDASYVPGTVRPRTAAGASNDTSVNFGFLTRAGLEQTPASNADKSRIQNHGYGASLFVQHLSNQRGDRVLSEIYDLQKASSGLVATTMRYTPVEALQRVTGDVSLAWNRFCEQYMAGRVFNGRPAFPTPEDILGAQNRILSLRMNAPTDPGRTFEWDAPDLSAQLYLVDLKAPTPWPAGSKLRFLLEDPDNAAEAILYRYRSAASGAPVWSLLQVVTDSWDLPNAEELANHGHNILIMVANGRARFPYTGRSAVKLTIESVSSSSSSYGHLTDLFVGLTASTVCKLTHSLTGVDTGPCTSNPPVFVFSNTSFASTGVDLPTSLRGRWNGNTFTAAGKETGRFYHDDWLTELELNLRAEVSSDGGTLTSGVFSYRAVNRGTGSTSAGAVETIECELKVAGVPRPNRAGQDVVMTFTTDGAQVPAMISGMKFKRTFTGPGGSPSSVTEFQSVNWTQRTPKIYVQFAKPQP